MLKLTEAIYNAMRRHGEETYPHECCGILLGRAYADLNLNRSEVVEAVRAGNTRTDSAHNRYNIAPQELVRAQRHGRENGLDIVGFYHSHPDHPAEWSQTDFAEAHWIGCSYVITSVSSGQAQTTNSFRLAGASEEDKTFEVEPIRIDRDTLPEKFEIAQFAQED